MQDYDSKIRNLSAEKKELNELVRSLTPDEIKEVIARAEELLPQR